MAGVEAPEAAVDAGGTVVVVEAASGVGAGEAEAAVAAGTVMAAAEGAEALEERGAKEIGGVPTPTVATPTSHGEIPAIG